MFVYRGERLKEDGYLQEEKQIRDIEYAWAIDFYNKQLHAARMEKEKLLADVDGEIKKYQMFVKPISELTREEKEMLIYQYEAMQEMLMGRVERKPTGYTDDDIETFRGIFKPTDPMRKVDSDIEYNTRMLVETKEEYTNSVTIALNRNAITKENVDAILEYARNARQKGKEVTVGIDCVEPRKNIEGVDYVFTKEELELLVTLDNQLKGMGCHGIRLSEVKQIKDLSDFKGTWTLEQVVNANNKIDDIVKHIQDNNLSPFEAMTYIHRWASNFIYNGDAIFEDARVLPSILNSTDIVCSGYASMVKAVVDKLNIPGLKCDLTGCYLIKGKSVNGHCHNIVTIDDPKYGINGTYIEDACWDSRLRGNNDSEGFAHCLYPVSDLEHFNNGIRYYSADKEDRLSNLIIDPKECIEGMEMSKANWFKKLIWRMSKSAEYKRIPKVLELYRDHSEPIPVEKYEEALRVMYSTVCDDPSKVEEMVKSSVEKSKKKSIHIFNSKANNSFARSVRKEERKATSKKAEGPKARL